MDRRRHGKEVWMKSGSQECHVHRNRGSTLLGSLALAVATACAFGAPSAFAELGGAPTLSPVDQHPVQQVAAESRKAASQAADTGSAASSATAATATATDWSMREVTLADGLIQREYLTADGVVFAVAWRGSHRPELSVLLGTQYATQMSQNARALRRQGRGSHSTTSQGDATFAVQASTHQRFSTGVAWLPQMLPAGLLPEALSIAPGS